MSTTLEVCRTPVRTLFLRTVTELGLLVLAGFCAFSLRFEFQIPTLYVPQLKLALLIWVAVKIPFFRWYGLDRRAWMHTSSSDIAHLVLANAIGSLASAILLFGLASYGFPRSIPILDWMLCSLLIGFRYLIRWWCAENSLRKRRRGKEVFIYGAGRAGVTLCTELCANSALNYNVVGFVDDHPKLQGMFVHGVKVLGRGRDLGHIAKRTSVKEVLIAVPSATGEQMSRILEHCQSAGARYRTVATLGEVVEGKAMAAQIRDVDVADLLSRASVELDYDLIRDSVQGKVVMVTGAAGSIGSELCRQLARFKPSGIVCFEIAESPLFHLVREMQAKFPEIPLYGEIGSVQNHLRVEEVLERYRPAIIYHAAAYKHVPIMEASIVEAVTNNVFGTYCVAQAAQQQGVEKFVLISSDKAVRPTSVMGATKRLCELVIRSMPLGSTRYVSVRFGNVLGSNGSVIPLFKEQIANGGPVRVTHPEMRRYFMTIPEASQLVLQASAMGRGGEIFVLEMGSQVKIVDIARKLILLSGLVPDVDIQIEFSGIRPGEKLYEELNLDEEDIVPTFHPKIKIFTGTCLPVTVMLRHLERLETFVSSSQTQEILSEMCELVPEYKPSEHVIKSIAELAPRRSVAAARMQVVVAAGG